MSLAPVGYRLEHGKLCRLDGRPFLHLVYTNGANEVSVFLRPWDDPEPSQGTAMETVNNSVLYTVDIGPEHLSFFQTRQLTAVVVSDQSDGKTALSVASSIARALEPSYFSPGRQEAAWAHIRRWKDFVCGGYRRARRVLGWRDAEARRRKRALPTGVVVA